jgi:hypothetical protein
MTDQTKKAVLAEALAHPQDRLEEHILVFHLECAGIIIGAGEYRCQECGQLFSIEELRNLV